MGHLLNLILLATWTIIMIFIGVLGIIVDFYFFWIGLFLISLTYIFVTWVMTKSGRKTLSVVCILGGAGMYFLIFFDIGTYILLLSFIIGTGLMSVGTIELIRGKKNSNLDLGEELRPVLSKKQIEKYDQNINEKD